MIADEIMQWTATLISLAGLVGVRRRATWGPALGALGSVTWSIYGSITSQYGLMLTEMAFMFSYLWILGGWLAEE